MHTVMYWLQFFAAALAIGFIFGLVWGWLRSALNQALDG